MKYITNLLALWKTKTFWLGIAIASATAFSADVQAYVAAHPGIAGSTISLLFGIFMRALTTQAASDKGTTSTAGGS